MSAVRGGLRWIKVLNEYMMRTKNFEGNIKKIKLLSLDNDTYKAEFVVDEDDLNRNKEFHQGLTATLIDTTSALTLIANHGYSAVSVNMHISHFKPAFVGDVLLIDAKLSSLHDCLASVKVELSKKNKEEVIPIAHGQSTFRVTPFTAFDHGYKP